MAPPGMSQLYSGGMNRNPFYRPRPVVPQGGGGQPGQMSNADLQKMIKEMIAQYQKQGAAASGGGGSIVPGAAAGGGVAYGVGGGGSALASSAAENALWNAGADAATAEAALTAGAADTAGAAAASTAAAEAAGATAAPSGLLTGAPAWAQVAAPAAFLLGTKALAPSIIKGGKKLGKLMGMGGNPPRPYNREDTKKSRIIENNLPGFKNLSNEQQDIFADRLHSMGLTYAPGDVESAKKGGLEHDTHFNFNKMLGFDPASEMAKEELERKYGRFWNKTISLDDFLAVAPKGIMKKEFRDSLDDLRSDLKSGTSSVDSQPSAPSAPPVFNGQLQAGPAYLKESDKKQGMFTSAVQDIANSMHDRMYIPGRDGDFDFGGIIDNKMLKSPPPAMIPRKDSPGFKNGRRINYNR